MLKSSVSDGQSRGVGCSPCLSSSLPMPPRHEPPSWRGFCGATPGTVSQSGMKLRRFLQGQVGALCVLPGWSGSCEDLHGPPRMEHQLLEPGRGPGGRLGVVERQPPFFHLNIRTALSSGCSPRQTVQRLCFAGVCGPGSAHLPRPQAPAHNLFACFLPLRTSACGTCRTTYASIPSVGSSLAWDTAPSPAPTATRVTTPSSAAPTQ